MNYTLVRHHPYDYKDEHNILCFTDEEAAATKWAGFVFTDGRDYVTLLVDGLDLDTLVAGMPHPTAMDTIHRIEARMKVLLQGMKDAKAMREKAERQLRDAAKAADKRERERIEALYIAEYGMPSGPYRGHDRDGQPYHMVAGVRLRV